MKAIDQSPKERPMEMDQHAFDECSDTLPMVQRPCVFDQVDLVLEDDDVLQFRGFDCGQMLLRLRLRTGFVSGDKQQCGVHDGGTVKQVTMIMSCAGQSTKETCRTNSSFRSFERAINGRSHSFRMGV